MIVTIHQGESIDTTTMMTMMVTIMSPAPITYETELHLMLDAALGARYLRE